MFYRRQPRETLFRPSALEGELKGVGRTRVAESEGVCEFNEDARVTGSVEEVRGGGRTKKEKGTKNKKSGNGKKEEEEEEEEEEDNDAEAGALETLAIIREMVADNAFIVACTRPLTQRERRDLVESSKVVVKNELIEAYEEVRDEMISL